MLGRLTLVAPLILSAFCSAQPAPKGNSDVRPSKMVIPNYPRIARIAGIQGDMDLTLLIGQEGQVISVAIDRGPALLELRRAVLEAARQSRFDCKNCDQEPQSYSMRYHFETKAIDPEKYCRTYGQLDPPAVEIDIAQARVSIYAWQEWTCDPRVEIRKFRSPKCLYLWNCGRDERTPE